MGTALATKECATCRTGAALLEGKDLDRFHRELGHDWHVVNNRRLEKEFKFKDFRDALSFTDAVGVLADAENHHPDLYLSWGKVRITLWTHKAGGLTENDFILAAKIDRL